MADIFEYLRWRGDLTFNQSPFHEVDAVILARFSYLPLELSTFDRIGQVCEELLALPDIDKKVLMAEDLHLLQAMQESHRYEQLGLLSYAERVDEQSQTQFAAVTIQLEKELYYVGFRGTDNTLVGWKEDFNMCFGPVPSQTLAVEYLNRVGQNLSGQIIVGGHSKGGNLAVYAGAFCAEEIRQQITAVYNFDGPGFHDEILQMEGYRSICQRVKTFVPQSSVVGMMLGHGESYVIVHSGQSGLLQHDVYSWEVERDHFSCVQTVTNSSRFVDATLKHWLAEVAPEQRERFVDAVYGVLLETNAKTVKEMSENKFGNGRTLLRALKKLEEEDRRAVLQALRALARCAKMSMNVISKPGRK